MDSTAPKLPKALAESLAQSKAEYKRLGKSGFRVSVPILGAMSFGHRGWLDWVLEEEEALPVLKAAYDRGLNTWDTANVYSNGVSEQIIAKAIKKYNIPRRKIIILTKCISYVAEEPDTPALRFHDEMARSKDYVNQAGLLLFIFPKTSLVSYSLADRTVSTGDFQRRRSLVGTPRDGLY
jgi:diketogulonate reductase-like aldo/keto reductase